VRYVTGFCKHNNENLDYIIFWKILWGFSLVKLEKSQNYQVKKKFFAMQAAVSRFFGIPVTVT